jgi:RNA polymerase sigma-70 factor (ECF subfamily)
MSTPLRERLWLYRIRSRRDPEAYASIYDQYVAQIYRFILFKVGDDEIAKELSSDTFLKTWEYLMEAKPVKSVSGLLYTIARSTIVDHYRKKKLELVSFEDVPDIIDHRLTGLVEANEEISVTLKAIKNLKDEYREALLMKHIDGLSNTEIAMALGKSGGTVRVLIHRATEALKDVMDRKH